MKEAIFLFFFFFLEGTGYETKLDVERTLGGTYNRRTDRH